MATYEIKHAIGDLVYIANAYDVDREVIKAVKIEGLKHTVKYGTKSDTSGSIFLAYINNGDGYNWHKPSEIFLDKESAVAHHERLKTIRDAERHKQEKKEKAERKAELLQELKDLEENHG